MADNNLAAGNEVALVANVAGNSASIIIDSLDFVANSGEVDALSQATTESTEPAEKDQGSPPIQTPFVMTRQREL